jgi:FKBP-type peptidyl-prolyl cis-trans isomerase 2
MCAAANKGDQVEILYTGKLKDQTVFDTTDDKGPFKFIVGSESIIKGINDAVLGMQVGDKKSIELSPEQAYGQYNDNLLAKVPKSKIPANAIVGDVLTDSNGNNWWIRQINDDLVVVDGNHPLAGQALIFDIELIKITH